MCEWMLATDSKVECLWWRVTSGVIWVQSGIQRRILLYRTDVEQGPTSETCNLECWNASF